jgi:uridine kinase
VNAGAAEIVAAIDRWWGRAPLVVAIDGHGAAGKTTLAAEVAAVRPATVIHTDDYFHPPRETADPRPMARYYAWPALRERALGPALRQLGEGPGGPSAQGLILVEGVSSAAPALADLVTRAVFVHTPEPLRLARLRGRISAEEWDEEWLAAEREYFTSRPPDSFDLVVSGVA